MPGLASLLGVLAAAAYVLCRQDVTHLGDVYWMLPKIQAGELRHPLHPLALHVANVFGLALDGCGSLHERLKIAGGLCTGASAGILTQAAWLLRRDRGEALAVGATFASLPATVHFATVMEIHALFLPFAAAAIWWACRLAAAPLRAGLAAGLVLGLLTAVASGVHTTGHLLAGWLALFLVALLRAANRPWRAIAITVAGIAAVHVAVSWLIACVLVPAPAGSSALASDVAASIHPTLRFLDGTIAGEWLWPYLPVSVLWLLAFARGPRPLPAVLAVLAVALLVHLACNQLLLVLPGPGEPLGEMGAYQLPLGFLATLLAIGACNVPARIAVLAVALAASAYHWTHPAKPPADRAFGRVAEAYLRANPVRLVVGDFAEFDGVFERLLEAPDLRARHADLVGIPQFVFVAAQHGVPRADELAAFFHPQLAGRVSVFTPSAFRELRAQGGVFAQLADQVLPRAFVLQEERVSAAPGAALLGHRLVPR